MTDPIWEWAKDELRTMMKPMPFQLLARMGIPTPEYTLVVDFGILGGAGVAGRTSVTGAVDSQGGMMTLFNIGGGGIAPIATSAGLTFGLSNARSVRSLPGNSVQIGGAFGVPAAVTGEVSIFRDQSTGVPYYSASVGGAAVAQPGVAIWGTAEHSAQVWEYNISDQLNAFYDWYIQLWFGE